MIKKTIKILISFLLITLISIVLLDILPISRTYDKDNTFIRKNERPLIIPHGGAKALYPENTLHAFKNTDQYDMFEIDLTLTKDLVLIAHHDLDLRHDLNRSLFQPDLLIKNLTYQEIVSIIKDNNYPYVRSFVNIDGQKPYENEMDQSILDEMIPVKLETIFSLYPNKYYILEIKDLQDETTQFEKAVEALMTLITNYDMKDNVIVSSFDDEVIKAFKRLSNNEITTSTASKETMNFVLFSAFSLDFFYKPTDALLIIPFEDQVSDSQVSLLKKLPGFIRRKIVRYDEVEERYLTNLVQKSLIEDAREKNLAVIFWTVNEKEDMRYLVELGVDGIITDRPDLLEEVLNEYEFN